MANAVAVMRGLQALLDIGQEGVEVDAQHDQIWAMPRLGSLESIEDTPAEQAAILRDAGWFWDDECDSWSLFT